MKFCLMSEYQNYNNVLVLAAHPDDETLGCGGTLKKISSQGHKINLLTFTDGVGSRSLNQKNRNKNLTQVCDILGIESFNFGSFPDNAMDTVSLLSICKFIEKNVNFHPDLIFTHFHADLNVDHQLVTKATLTVFRPQDEKNSKIYSYYVPSSTDYNSLNTFDGNSYFKLNQLEVEAKIEALKTYEEEMRPYPHSRSYENIENLMKVWGCEVGASYAEKFKLIRETT